MVAVNQNTEGPKRVVRKWSAERVQQLRDGMQKNVINPSLEEMDRQREGADRIRNQYLR